jgi:hypothetical protein
VRGRTPQDWHGKLRMPYGPPPIRQGVEGGLDDVILVEVGSVGA